MSLEVIAKQLVKMSEPIVLIYAFNGTGKTQLSVAYKNATKAANDGKHSGVYFNAYSEDLFVWDNDEESDGADIKLNILPSTLNQFHSFLSASDEVIMDKLAAYNPKYRFRFNLFDDLEKGIESITFFIEDNEDAPIKISRGEENIFIWCFYLALLEVDGWANEQDAHIFIDDPVSSLDEHNIFITAETLYQQIESHYKKKRIIITTHHIGLLSILSNRLTKGEKSGRYKNLTSVQILKRVDGELKLEPLRKNVFLYHLHLLQVLDEVRKGQLYTYHFAMLRQLLEYVASFSGSGRTGHTLDQIGIEDVDNTLHVINTHSHKNVYYDQTEMMSETEQNYFNLVFSKLVATYKFSY
jgi:wobble nucleotide-excising tRNase